MSFREASGLVLIIAALVVVPAAWVFSRLLWLPAFFLFAVGGALFYTERMLKGEDRLEKEATGSAAYGPAMPTDIHNYTGWRSGGRSPTMDPSSDAGGGD